MAKSNRRYPIEFEAGARLAHDSDYVIVQPSWEDGPGPAIPLGDGGAGVVYRATFKGAMQRAIKFLSPAARLSHLDSEQFEDTFLREISVLVEVTHSHISKITDFGATEIGEHRVLYYAMDYVEGVRLTQAWRQPSFTGRAFLDVIDQLLSALEYLHARGIMHCDVKPDNILVHRAGPRPFSATLVDLGVAKVIGASAGPVVAASVLPLQQRREQPRLDTPEGEGWENLEAELAERLTYFFSTPRIVRQIWKDRLRRAITRPELEAMFPSHELYAIGVLLEDALKDSRLAAELLEELRTPGLSALETVRDRLLTEHPEDDYYRSVSALRQDWAKLERGYLAPLGVPELAVAAGAKTAIATPTGRVSLTDRLLAVVNHPLFQRLHEIPQLELNHLLFPGARHSRFLHSLSVFDTSRQYLTHLLADPRFRLMVEPVDIQGLLLRALLHDIGHYPLSHMFEDFADEQRRGGGPLTVPTDDDLFWQFVIEGADDKAPEFAQYAGIVDRALVEVTGGGVRPLRAYLRDTGNFTDGAVAAMSALVHPRTESHAVLAGILSSPVDADKVSYLMDDSLMTGVRYGLGIDLDALLGALCAPAQGDLRMAVQDGDHPETTRGLRPTIALKDKGLPAAESVVLARYWMLKRVYWHHTSRAIMAMVKFVIASLLAGETGFSMERYVEATMFGTPHDGLKYLSDAFGRLHQSASSGRRRRDPIRGLLGGNRMPYKRIVTIASAGEETRIYTALAFRQWGGLNQLAEVLSAAIETEVPECKPLRDGDVIIDVPVRQREELGGKAIVYMQKNPGVGRVLLDDKTLSPVLAGFKEEFDTHVKKCRVFVHPAVYEVLECRLEWVRAALWERLEDHCGQGS